jgi:hypothetical protein
MSATEPPFRVQWNSTNAENFLIKCQKQRIPLAAVDISGEPNDFASYASERLQQTGLRDHMPGIIANGTIELKAVLERVYGAHPEQKPLLAGPFVGGGDGMVPDRASIEFVESYLSKAGALLDVVSWDYYPMSSTNPRATAELVLEPSFLDNISIQVPYYTAARDKYAPHAQIWLPETASYLIGGKPNVSDHFVSGFWYLDQLGYLASAGAHDMVAREQYWDGVVGDGGAPQDYYGLLTADYQPTPDLFTHILWKRLVGSVVLETSRIDGVATGTDSPTWASKGQHVRVYAHCAKAAPGITLIVVNLLNKAMELKIEGTNVTPRLEYIFTSEVDGELASATSRLNGVKLTAKNDASHSLPRLVDMGKKMTTGNVLLPAQSYGYVLLPGGAPRAVCHDGRDPREAPLSQG